MLISINIQTFLFNSRMHSIYIYIQYVKAAGKSHIQVLNRSSKAGAALVKTIASSRVRYRPVYHPVYFMRDAVNP